MAVRLLLFSLLATLSSVAGFAADRVDYARDVYPILEMYCVGCHNTDDAQGGLVMDAFDGLIRGGDSGSAITPGTPGSSRLLLMASGKLDPVMPPDDAEGPDEQELATLAAWIEQGANGPEGDLPVKRQLRTPKIKPTFEGSSPITAIAISPDGRWTARGRFGEIEVSGSGQEVTTITDTDLGKINSLVFSPDSKQLLAASGLTGAYGRAAIYEVGDGKLVRELVGHRDTLYAATFSHDRSLIATAGYDRVIVLWDAATGEPLRELKGHNGAIFDLAFSPDDKILVSACADETAKVWRVADGQRLDTLSQPEGEVLSIAVTADGRFVVAGSGDNRLRVWRLVSVDRARINPLVATRFVDETPIVNFAISPNGDALVTIAQSGNLKVIRTADWQPVASLEPLGESATDLVFSPDGKTVTVSLMSGEVVRRDVPTLENTGTTAPESDLRTVYMDLGDPASLTETKLRQSMATNLPQSLDQDAGATTSENASSLVLDVERHVVIEGVISEPGEVDVYRWPANRGEVWAIDADHVDSGRLDPIVTVTDAAGVPVTRVRLQAVRDSYFTFRGKDSTQVGDFRIFNWQEMKLSEYLYAGGEVSRLWMHPRGPDSGFNVYPGEGTRWTYFGTSGTTHALGEPAYIVRPLPRGATPLANGLPVFDITYENDDDPFRKHGKDSRLLFTAPEDGLYRVRVTDTRGEGGAEYGYRLAIRPAEPGFEPRVEKIGKPLRPATGRECKVTVDRVDGYQGPVTFELEGLPDRLSSNFPVTVQEGQAYAVGMIWAGPNETGWDDTIEPRVKAWAMINGKRVERNVGTVGELAFDPATPSVVPRIVPLGSEVGTYENWTLQVPRGQTVSARVAIDRKEGFNNEVSFGKEFSGRNASQGVYVDNIGLNGLLILADATEREFFLTADETAVPGKRSFFLTAGVEGGLTSHPITVEVLP
ncbi:hypothetical protein FYK55_20195 [Roseiconus nitratireducens]|uniref:Cytochrome C Planctomycete-type domain-containing protein n=1 Tax=Roseiconus nitratireducens TaxID=2605748 RepID=A0A5M6D343_9BACT|nr:c-type cytochrome domain-containing protein [Roseiconus nitratireducens]KAA5540712.1 hypothetical protein FYK55_20195 [Roseiconus nitratireducens]